VRVPVALTIEGDQVIGEGDKTIGIAKVR